MIISLEIGHLATLVDTSGIPIQGAYAPPVERLIIV